MTDLVEWLLFQFGFLLGVAIPIVAVLSPFVLLIWFLYRRRKSDPE